MIIAGDRYALTEKENNMYAIEMILHIKRLQSSDFGGYKCISKNSIGDTEGTIRLYGKIYNMETFTCFVHKSTFKNWFFTDKPNHIQKRGGKKYKVLSILSNVVILSKHRWLGHT